LATHEPKHYARSLRIPNGVQRRGVSRLLQPVLAAGCLDRLFCQQAKTRMDRGKVVVEHPAKPDRLTVARLLALIVMADAEVICEIEEICLVLRREDAADLRAKKFAGIRQISDGVAPVGVKIPDSPQNSRWKAGVLGEACRTTHQTRLPELLYDERKLW
jgi:hypothetical protein